MLLTYDFLRGSFMKKRLLAGLSGVLLGLIFVALRTGSAQAANPPTITFLNPPANGEVHLHVGESYTAHFHVDSDSEFVWARAIPSAYFPGRGVFTPNPDRSGQGTSADLSLTWTGKDSTADLGDGYNIVYAYIALNYKNNEKVYNQYELHIYVTP
jgi:hypothetical protein